MRTLFPGLLGIACCALALNSSAQSSGQGLAVDLSNSQSYCIRGGPWASGHTRRVGFGGFAR